MSFIYCLREINEQRRLQNRVDIRLRSMWSHRVDALCIAPRLTVTGLWNTMADFEVELCNRRSRSRHSRAPAAPKTSRSPGLLEPSVAVDARAEPSLQP